MSGKRILAGIFAVLVLVKLTALLVNPGKWLTLGNLLLAQSSLLTGVYVVLLIITGYYIFSSLGLVDIALVMFFTSLLTGLTLMPYTAQMLKLGDEMTASGFDKAWLAMVIWGAIAVAVLIKAFSKR